MSSLYFRAARLGTQIRLPDGREATTVFNGLTGIGIKWGLHYPKPEDFKGTAGDFFEFMGVEKQMPEDWPWEPDAMLREPEISEKLGMECVGEDYEIIYRPEH